MGPYVKTHGELSIRALRQARDRELAIWYLSRFLDEQGSGYIPIERLHGFARENHLLVWDSNPISRANLTRRLQRGSGVFWPMHARVVYYHSLWRVCTALQVVPWGKPVGIPLRAYATQGTLRAFLYAAWIGSGRIISRRAITEATGLTKQTILRYEKIGGVHKQENVAMVPYEDPAQAELMLCWLNEADGKQRAWLSQDRRTLIIQMPNTLFTDLPVFPQGQNKKTRRGLRGVLEETPTALRRYFDHGKQARQAVKRGQSANEFFVDTGTTWRGRQVWTYHPSLIRDTHFL